MLKKYLLPLSLTFFFNIFLLTWGWSVNYGKLDNAAENYSRWIMASTGVTSEEIDYATYNIFSIEEIDEDRDTILKNADSDDFMKLYNKIVNPRFIGASSLQFIDFANLCKDMFIEAEEKFDILKQSSIHMILKRTSEKIKGQQIS